MNSSRKIVVRKQAGPVEIKKLSVSVRRDIAAQLRVTAFTHEISESSIVEIALATLFARMSPAALGTFLKQQGGCLRRKTGA